VPLPSHTAISVLVDVSSFFSASHDCSMTDADSDDVTDWCVDISSCCSMLLCDNRFSSLSSPTATVPPSSAAVILSLSQSISQSAEDVQHALFCIWPVSCSLLACCGEPTTAVPCPYAEQFDTLQSATVTRTQSLLHCFPISQAAYRVCRFCLGFTGR